jgi:hypothetical protein
MVMQMGIGIRGPNNLLIAALALAALGTSAFSQDDPNSLCVVDVPFSETVPVAISQVYVAPDTVRDVGNRSAPLVYGLGKLPADSKGQYKTKKIFWPLNEGAPGFASAYDPGPNIALGDGEFASDGEKTVIAINGEYQDSNGKRVETYRNGLVWKTRLLMSKEGGKFALLPLFEDQAENPSSIKWNMATKRFIVEVFQVDMANPDRNSGKSVYYALSDGKLTAMANEEAAQFTLPYGTAGEALELSQGALAYRSATGEQSILAERLLESFDFGGWIGLFPIGEPGWYLAAAVDTATAFELDMSVSPPKVTRKIIYRPNQGTIGEIFTWLFGLYDSLKKDYLADEIVANYPEIADGSCFQFSPWATRLFRCDGKVHVRGAVERAGDDSSSGEFRFKGDASAISAAVLVSGGGAVVSQTPSGFQDIEVTLGERPYSLFDFPSLKRSFIADSGSVYEIVNDGGRAKAVRIGFGQKQDWFFVSALQIEKSSEPMFFTRTGVFRIIDGTLQQIWKPRDSQIMITGGAGPTAIGKWQGIMFAAGDGFQVSGFKLLTSNAAFCDAKQ